MRTLRIRHIFLSLALAAIVGLAGCRSGRIAVEIQNVDNEALSSVTVHVTGNSYTLRNLQPNHAKTVMVAPRGESHIEIEFENKKRVNAGGYYEPGYSGRVMITVKKNQVVDVRDDVKPRAY